ncbi:MAG TPA: 6-bladed beta-propeller [Gemmatimonadota bacterium]|nr:6-bladed beta-propeller [Gemmatimonadota bacterium]
MTPTVETLPDGATLVRHTPPADGVPVTWRLDEELRIGTMEGGGPAQFGRVGGLDVAPDGRIIVLDAQAQDIRVFDADGRHLRTLGRKGGGPGELEGANGVVLGEDGLLRVPDGRNDRVSYFDLDAGFVRSYPYTPLYVTWTFDGVLDENGVLWAIHRIPPDQPGERGQEAYVGYDSAGVAVDTLPRPVEHRDPRNDPGFWAIERDGRMMASLGVPFYARAQHVLDRRLRFWSTVLGDPTYRLERRDPGAEPDLVIETGRPLQPVDRAAADSIAAGWEREYAVRLDRSKIPENAPAIINFFMDDDERLWVVARTPDSDSTGTLDAYDSIDGRWLGTLVADFPLMAYPPPVIRGDRVWAVVWDELDVSYVVQGRMVGVGDEPEPEP